MDLIYGGAWALVFFCAAAARADFDPVDWSSTSFTFSNPPTTHDRTIFVTMLSRVITAQRIYMEHRNLSENFRAIFNDEGVEGWKSLGNKAVYDVAEFTRGISGRNSNCITVQRYTNPMHVGYKRHVIGRDARWERSRASTRS